MSDANHSGDLVTVDQVHKFGSKADSVVALRVYGASFAEIADQLGYANEEAARKAFEHGLAGSIDNTDRKRMRQVMGEQLNRMIRAARSKALDPSHPDQLPALRTMTSILDRKAKLYGLDEPTQVAVSSPSDAVLQEWVAAALAKTEGELPTEADVIEGEIVDGDAAA